MGSGYIHVLRNMYENASTSKFDSQPLRVKAKLAGGSVASS